MNPQPAIPNQPAISPAPKRSGWVHNVPLQVAVPLTLLAFGLVVIVLQALFFARYNIDEATRTSFERCKQVGLRAARLAARHLPRRERTIFKLELARIDLEPGVDLILLCDAKGIINSAKHAPYMGRTMDSVLSDDAVEIVQKAVQSDIVTTVATPDHTAVMGSYPVILSTGEVYAIYLQMDLTAPLNRARHAAIVQGAVSAAVLLASCGILWALLNSVITRRVRHIVAGARDLAEGRTPVPPLHGSDELAVIDREMRSAHATVAGQAAEVRAQRERYRLMVDSLPVAVLTLRNAALEYINPAGARMLGLEHDALHAQADKQIADLYAFAENHLARNNSWPQDYRLLTTAGAELLLEVIAYKFDDAQGSALQLVMNDVSERRALEARREALGHEIANASEREQRRIGQDLHDDICQRLAAVKMSMQDFEEQLAENAPMLVDKADDIVDRLTDAIHVTRSLARGLSPVDIEAGGIGVALDGLARTAREVLGVECTVEMPDPVPELTVHAATQLYRIAQECLNNAAKHAKASRVAVSLSIESDDTLQLRVVNDGRPFGELSGSSTSGSHSGMGLHIMRYRAQSMQGVLNFDLKPSHATTAVSCSIPLKLNTLPS